MPMEPIDINHYTYSLPSERIALFPLENRDQSKLLVYQQGKVEHRQFQSLPDLLPSNTLLFFNDTKVIPARLHFTKETGAVIEVFLLSPIAPSTLLAEAMVAHRVSRWKCTIGNLKRWTEGKRIEKKIGDTSVQATLLDEREGVVEFHWESDQSFAELIRLSGETPLPPYIKRKAEGSDRERYQTVYAHYEGAVAAPTAGLHFTPGILETLQHKGITSDYVTLHVSAGTFQPVKVQNAAEHIMHNEQVVISRKNLENLMDESRFIVAVGTTSLRTLESSYWFGANLLQDPTKEFAITQHDPYQQRSSLPSKKGAISAVLRYLESNHQSAITGRTSLYIMPGYTFRICRGLVTNFHQPGSTLILLVAAFVGNDWKKIYSEAMANDYRFLSYGDSSLLLP